MRIAYWMALALGMALIVYVVVFGFMVVVFARLSSPMALDCQPISLVGFGCGSARVPGFLFEASLGIRALAGGILVWAFFRHRRDARMDCRDVG
jgi:hypothetical protein